MKLKLLLICMGSFSMMWAFAQDSDFRKIDSNQDGKIDLNEYKMNSHMFEKWDQNGDNRLTKEEFQNRFFSIFDSNSDDEINMNEWNMNRPFVKDNAGFNTWDADGNGSVSKNEFSNQAGNMFTMWDKNGDMIINKDEFNEKSFEWWDFNKDVLISENEFSQMKDLTKNNRSFWDKLFF